MFQPFLPFRLFDAKPGHYHDLEDSLARMNARYFGGAIRTRIAWGRKTEQRRRTIHFGSFDFSRTMIRIHPALDRPEVPLMFLDFVVYHELLHADLGMKKDGSGRRVFHSREFRHREREFDQYELARAWERANIQLFFQRRRATKQRRLAS